MIGHRDERNVLHRATGVAASGSAPEHGLGAVDAEAGVPHPLAESREDARQPVARLHGFHADAVARVQAVRRAVHAGLNEVERLHFVLPAMIDGVGAEAAALLTALQGAERGRERWLARWRITAIFGGLAVGLPAEVYLTALSLNFLDVSDPWAQRFLAVAIAVALALTALVAANGEKEAEKWVRYLALAVSAAMLLGLALLRWGVMPNASWLEASGALLVMAVAAFAFVIWTMFVKRRIEDAVAQHAQWQNRMRLEHELRSAQAQHDLLVEMRDGLPAEAQNHRDRGITELREVQAGFSAAAARWWSDYQVANAAAAPDIRSQLDELKQELEGDVLAATGDIDDRAASLRALTGGGQKRTP
jgi:hypothetical protein